MATTKVAILALAGAGAWAKSLGYDIGALLLAFSESKLGYVVQTAATTVAVICMFVGLVILYISSGYKSLIKDNKPVSKDKSTGQEIHLDEYVRDTSPTILSRLQVCVLHKLNVGSHVPSKTPLQLAETPSPFVSGLRVTSNFATSGSGVKMEAPPGALVVGTIRMGFGHHRIAYAATSWALGSGKATYFHDLLNIDSPEATLIKDMDKMYSKGSRMATEFGGPVEKLWGSFTKGGNENSLRVFYQMAQHLQPLLLGLDKNTPIITTHCFVGLIAVSLGFTKVINLVIDNLAQWFIVVPGAYNLVQGPSNYHNLMRMGVPADRLILAGGWIPKDMVDNIDADCNRRIERAKARAQGGAKLRLLIPVGGAGAQKTFVTNFVSTLKAHVLSGKVELLLNAGDHEHMRTAFLEAIKVIGVQYDLVEDKKGVDAFCEAARAGKPLKQPITLFAFKDYFPAVATTDLLGRVTDVLCCKPSELAFYPVPKLMIRRVGDHEAYSALRASELGDGTLELREVEDAMAYVKLMIDGPELLTQMNDCIKTNCKAGLYNGCKKAVELANELAKQH